MYNVKSVLRVKRKRKTRVNAALNACKRSAKRVYAKRVYSTLNAFAGNAFCETSSRAKGLGCGSLA